MDAGVGKSHFKQGGWRYDINMRSRIFLLVFSLLTVSFAVPFAAHAAIPFFGPIVPEEINRCAAGWGALIDVANRIIELLITLGIVFVAPIRIAYAGFLYVVNPVNPSGIARAKKVLWDTVIGIVIMLAAWMIVDAVMAVLYNANAPAGANSGVLGTWSSLITSSGDSCLIQESLLQNLNQTNLSVSGVSANGSTVYISGRSGALCSDANPACSPAALQAAGFTPTQANVMSCIAGTENSGSATGCTGNACGTFQIMLTVNPLVGPACGGTLNCPALCHGNNGAAVQTASCQPCVQAANNPQCNAQAAQYLYSQSGYAPWTTSSDNPNSAACIQQYGSG